MTSFANIPLKGFILKIIVIGIVVFSLGVLFKYANENELSHINYIILIGLSLYALVNILHVFYTALYVLYLKNKSILPLF